MGICCCTLSGTKACEHCPNNIDYGSLYSFRVLDSTGTYSDTPSKPMTIDDLKAAIKLIEKAEKEKEELDTLFKSFRVSQAVLNLKKKLNLY